MMKYISLLRGINVSGQKKIRMEDLRNIYESLGFSQVVSYIQSGNVIFEAKSDNPPELKTRIENSIMENYGFHVHVELRAFTDLEKIIKKNPFGSIDPETEGTKVLVSFLSDEPNKDNIKRLMEYVYEPEKLIVKGNEVFLHCPGGYGKSKLSNNFLENKLKVKATTRNWKTIIKLYDLSIH